MRRAACVCAFVVSLVALGCGVAKETYIAKGNVLFSAERYDEASLNYRKALQQDTNFGEAHYRLGLAAIKLGQGRLAFDELDRAVHLLPANVDAREKFGDLCLGVYLADRNRPLALYTRLIKLSDELLSNDRNSYEGLLIKGHLAATDKKLTESIECFRKALRVNPSSPSLVTRLVEVLIEDGQVQQGEELAMNLISRKKTTFGPIYDSLYSFYMGANRVSEAEEILKAKVKNNPKRVDYLVQLARYYSSQRKPAEMQATLRRILDDPTHFPAGCLQVGDFYLGRGDFTQSIGYYQEGLRANPDARLRFAYQKRSIIALLGNGNKGDAIRLAGQAVQENPTDSEALHLHAGILLDSGKRENAELAVSELQMLAARTPNDASLRLQLGQAYRLKGDLNAACSQLLESIKRQPDLIATRYELAEIFLMTERPADAVLQANKILDLRPNDRRARLLKTGGMIATGDGETVRGELALMIKQSPRDLEPQIQLGFLAVAEKKYSEAVIVLGNHRESGDPRVFTGLAVAYLHQQQYDQAREALAQGLSRSPNSPMLLEQLADTEALAGNFDLAIEYLRRLLASDPNSVKLHRRMAEVYELKGDHGNEVTCYRRASELEPHNPTASLGLARALVRAGRTSEARTEFVRVVNEHPENAPALNNAAFFLADTGGDLDEALRLAQHALAKIPGQPGFSDTVGYIYLKKGLYDSAVQTFSNLARKYPDAIFRYHLGLALYEKGDKAAARRELQGALSGHPSSDDKTRISDLLARDF